MPATNAALVTEVADRLSQPRRILDLLTRRQLAALRGRWFGVDG